MDGGGAGWPSHRPCCHASGGDPAGHAPAVTRSSFGAALGCCCVAVDSSVQPGASSAAGSHRPPHAPAPALGRLHVPPPRVQGSLGKSHCSTFSSSSVKQMQLSPVAVKVDCGYLFEALSSSERWLRGPAGARGRGVANAGTNPAAAVIGKARGAAGAVPGAQRAALRPSSDPGAS